MKNEGTKKKSPNLAKISVQIQNMMPNKKYLSLGCTDYFISLMQIPMDHIFSWSIFHSFHLDILFHYHFAMNRLIGLRSSFLFYRLANSFSFGNKSFVYFHVIRVLWKKVCVNIKNKTTTKCLRNKRRNYSMLHGKAVAIVIWKHRKSYAVLFIQQIDWWMIENVRTALVCGLLMPQFVFQFQISLHFCE